MPSVMETYGASAEWVRQVHQRSGGGRLARVVSQDKRRYRLMTEGGEVLGEVSGKFRHSVELPTDFPAVGDFVIISEKTVPAVIQEVLPRKSVFQRQGAGNAYRAQVVAANVDCAFVCMSLNGNFNINRLERYLTVARQGRSTPVVVLTKLDAAGEDAREMIEAATAAACGADVLVTRSDDLSTVRRILEYLPVGRTGAFIGSSGVGKSTLVNALCGRELQQTTAVRESDDKGRHTTSRREMFVIPGAGIVIDTPGMRELGIDTESLPLETAFEDIEELARYCWFSDCHHQTEPRCAVKQAVEDGKLDPRRLENYIKIKFS